MGSSILDKLKGYTQITGADFEKGEVYFSIDPKMVEYLNNWKDEDGQELEIQLTEEMIIYFEDPQELVSNGCEYTYDSFQSGLTIHKLINGDFDIPILSRYEWHYRSLVDELRKPFKNEYNESFNYSDIALYEKEFGTSYNEDYVIETHADSLNKELDLMPTPYREQVFLINDQAKILDALYQLLKNEFILLDDVGKVLSLLKFRFIPKGIYKQAYLKALKEIDFFKGESYKKKSKQAQKPPLVAENWKDLILYTAKVGECDETDKADGDGKNKFDLGIYVKSLDDRRVIKAVHFFKKSKPNRIGKNIRRYLAEEDLSTYEINDLRSVFKVLFKGLIEFKKPEEGIHTNGKFIFDFRFVGGVKGVKDSYCIDPNKLYKDG